MPTGILYSTAARHGYFWTQEDSWWDYDAETEECLGDVYRSAIRQGGYTPIEGGFGLSLVDREGNRVTLGLY